MIGLCLISSVQALAQPLFARAESIESTVANADLVFLATLVDFRAAGNDKMHHEHVVTISIEETLKQAPISRDEPYQKLSLDLSRPASVLADWKARSSRLLVACQEYAPQETIVIELVRDKLEVMSAEMTLVRDPETVIRIAKETVRRMPAHVKRVHTFELQVPREIVVGTGWEQSYDTGGHLRLSVPVNQQLEKRAQNYVRSKNPLKREEGAWALVYFKSDENLELVRSLLADPGVTYQQPAYEDKAGERIFGVRYQAYRTLKSWGINVAQPVIREEVRK